MFSGVVSLKSVMSTVVAGTGDPTSKMASSLMCWAGPPSFSLHSISSLGPPTPWLDLHIALHLQISDWLLPVCVQEQAFLETQVKAARLPMA